MKCGHCKNQHDTAAEVFACSQKTRRGGTKTAPRLEGPLRLRNRIGDRKPLKIAMDLGDKLTPGRQAYLHDLLKHFSIELDGNTVSTIDNDEGQRILTTLIDARRYETTGKPFVLPVGTRHLAHPNRGVPRERTPSYPPLPEVPDGHYAIPDPAGNNDYAFYKVYRYNGKVYIKTIIGGHPEYRLPGGMRNLRRVLQAILDFGPDKAGLLYGQELDQCQYCNQHLTKYASRILSAGRKCCYDRGKGEQWDAVQALRPEGTD